MSEIQNAQTKRHTALVRMTLTAVLIALAIVAKLCISVSVPFLGAGGMHIGLTGVITAFPAILFGPLYGGAASMLCDIMGYLIKPEGAYIPWLSLTAFAGGALKGIIWNLLKKCRLKRQTLLAVVSAIFFLLFSLGVASHISLAADGVNRRFVSVQTALPGRGQIENMTLSPLSRFVTALAQYNRDTVTLTRIPDAEAVEVPEKVTIDGVSCNVTKIAENAFAECSQMKQCIIPASCKTIADGAFGDRQDVTICGVSGSAAQAYAKEHGFSFREVDFFTETVPAFTDGKSESDGYAVKSSDTYRKYLSGYINFATLGLELVGFLGLLAVLFAALTRKRGGVGDCFAGIALTVSAAGVCVTTVNTWILMRYLSAWHGRPFLLLLVPRVIEELVVCMVQAYLIAVLYDIYRNRGISKKIH